MILAYLTLLTALAISGVAAYYSIIGLIAIFSASVIPIAVMGVVLETGKLVTAAWLYHYWKKVNVLLKTYLISAVFVLMFITSMGIFGFLSKAHIEQTSVSADNTLQIESIDSQITRQRTDIDRAEKQLTLLDDALEKYVELGAITKGLNARKDQQGERDALTTTINDATDNIATLTQTKYELRTKQNELIAEVGPIKYIAELVYGNSDTNTLEEAVRWVILILVWVFDPLAVLLLISANISIKEELTKLRRKRTRRKSTLRKRENKQTAWERKLQESKRKDGELTEVTHKNGDVIAKYYE
jgi:septal ring factor EnvC (AmiA/AmiB activator)|tara:strand:- start:225 stop:1127 length:903 start_codon:yes stop_codon:yes gene_type:complete